MLLLGLFPVFKNMESLSFDSPTEIDVVRRFHTTAKIFRSLTKCNRFHYSYSLKRHPNPFKISAAPYKNTSCRSYIYLKGFMSFPLTHILNSPLTLLETFTLYRPFFHLSSQSPTPVSKPLSNTLFHAPQQSRSVTFILRAILNPLIQTLPLYSIT